jgi:hypothetical protein
MIRFLRRVLALMSATAAFLLAAAMLALPSYSALATPSGSHRVVSASKKAKHKKKQKKSKKKAKPKQEEKAAGPSVSVVGLGINRLYVPAGKTVSSNAQCAEMVASENPSVPIGPPQQVYLVAFMRATDIPASAPTRIADELPEGDSDLDEPELSPPTPWSKAFASGSFVFGSPPGSTKDLFHALILSASAEEGEYEGPSAEEFDGIYSWTVSVEVGGHTLTSAAKVTVDCPILR